MWRLIIRGRVLHSKYPAKDLGWLFFNLVIYRYLPLVLSNDRDWTTTCASSSASASFASGSDGPPSSGAGAVAVGVHVGTM
ncbi:hypothetical protein FIBSPDRAFT_876509, partial [Athelia psychrophila]